MADILLSGSVGAGGAFPILGQATAEIVGDADLVLTSAVYTNLFLAVTSDGTMTAPRSVIAPLFKGLTFIVQNDTTEGFAIVLQGASGIGVSIPSTKAVLVATDGVNYFAPGGGSGSGVLFVADPAALTALSTAGFDPGQQCYVDSLATTQNPYQYNPNDDGVADPLNFTRIPAEGGGFWVSVPQVLGTSTYGTFTFGGFPTAGDTENWTTIGAGQTATVYAVPTNSSLGEMTTISAEASVQAALPALVVLGATGNGVSPIVLHVDDSAGVQTGAVGHILGVLGNTAANGTKTLTVVDATHVSLDGTTGNGAYVSGGTVDVLDFGSCATLGTFRELFGQTLTAQGSSTGIDISAPPPPLNVSPSLVGVVFVCAAISGAIVLRATAPAAMPIRIGVSGSYVRRPAPTASAPPTLTGPLSVTSGPASGGTATQATGTNLTSTTSVSFVFGGTTFPAASFTVGPGGTTLDIVTGFGPGFGGTADLLVVTPGGTATILNAFDFETNPLAIMGGPGIVAGWYENDSFAFSGSVATAWRDKSGNGQDLAAIGAPVYNPVSSSITPPGPTVTTDGATSAFIDGGFNLAPEDFSGPTNLPLFFWVVAKFPATHTDPASIVVEAFGNFLGDSIYFAALVLSASFTGTNFPWSGSLPPATVDATAWTDGTTGPGTVNAIDVNNGTPVTATTTGVGRLQSQVISVCVDHTGAANFLDLELVALMVCNVVPSAPQRAALQSYKVASWG